MDDKLFTKQQVAEFLGCSERSVDRLDANPTNQFPRSTRGTPSMGVNLWGASPLYETGSLKETDMPSG